MVFFESNSRNIICQQNVCEGDAIVRKHWSCKQSAKGISGRYQVADQASEMSRVVWSPGGGGGGVLKKVLYGEALPRGPTPYPFIYHFFQKRHPFRIPFIGKRHPFHIPSYE